MTRSTIVSEEARELIACDLKVGGGNAFDAAVRISPAPDAPYLRSDTRLTDVDGIVRDSLSLAQLASLVDAWGGWYSTRGVGPRDRVGIYVGDAVTNLVHFLALTRLGAIAVPVNGDLEAATALTYLRRTAPAGILTDDIRRVRLGHLLAPAEKFWVSSIDATSPGRQTTSTAYAHTPTDPLLLCHTSGTTGTPKSVIWTHAQMMEGVRSHLTRFRDHERSSILSALPQSHGSALGYALMAMLTGVPLTLLAAKDAPALAAAIERHNATVVVAFAGTLSGLAVGDLRDEALESVERWISVGDASHDAHVSRLVRTGQHQVGDRMLPGSMYVDGFGSSELGWGGVLSRITIPGVSAPPRCLGMPLAFAELAVLRTDGTLADVGEVGLLGVKGQTVTPGYWDDSDRTFRSRLNGYWLAGDLVYRDKTGRYFHVDRMSDAITTAEGVVYSTLTEEIILSHAPEVRDCVVVAEETDGAQVAVALLDLRSATDPEALLARINESLLGHSRPRLSGVRVVDPHSIPTGVTGKVLKRRLRDRPPPSYHVAPPDGEIPPNAHP